jgi:hypothetical protein
MRSVNLLQQAAMVCLDASGNHVRIPPLKLQTLEASNPLSFKPRNPNPYSVSTRNLFQGAARIGFAAFPYSVYALGMKDVVVVTV